MQMLIKGIRSFSPDNTAVVEFYRPLTLIVGHNGAGKTVMYFNQPSQAIASFLQLLGRAKKSFAMSDTSS